jgi:3-deoxy-manno-octulosonate cytidylyltransferase (CMP-KDO synthetase)
LRGVSGVAKPLIQRSWEAARSVPGVASVHIATDHPEIADVARGFGADVLMTSPACRNGTERCAEAIEGFADVPDLVINLQGDAPLTPPHFITALVDAFGDGTGCPVATPALHVSGAHHARLKADEAAGRVGGTSVVTDSKGRALYFSKRLIPYFADGDADPVPLRLHVGVYAYTPSALRTYRASPVSELEQLEGLEQLRFLDAGVAVRVVDVAPPGWQIWELNNPSDIVPIETALAIMGRE